MADALGLGVTAWSPLGGGVLTGKYKTGQRQDARYENDMMKSFMPSGDRLGPVVEAVQAVAREVGRSPAQVALAWLRERPIPVIPIVGARRLEQFRDNLACLDLRLEASQLARLDAPSRVELGFPYDFYERAMVKSFVHGGLGDRIET
jgi:aryl-alcohol dehydrogenase-like predicted oxidoreductase